MDNAAVTPSDHFRQLALTESSVYVSYELQWCQYGDCRGLNRATTHMFSEIFEKFTENPVFAQSFLAQEKKPGLSGAARARWWGCRGLPRIKLCRVLDGLGLTHCAKYQAPNVSARGPSSPPNTPGEDDVSS